MQAVSEFCLCNKPSLSCPGRSIAAINRATGTIQGNSIVAVLSTSTLLLPASTADSPASVPLINGMSSQESASDIFVAFEQIRSSAPDDSSWKAPGEGTGVSGGSDGGNRRNTGAEGTQNDHYGHSSHPRDAGNERACLLITVVPSHVPTDGGGGVRPSHQSQRDKGASSRGEEEGEGRDRQEGAEDPQPPRAIIRDAAPFPLLVFDTEALSALGELDERFAFQGGVAEWISRARLGSIDQGGIVSAEMDGSCCFDASTRRHRGSPGGVGSEMDRDNPTGRACSDGTTVVKHVHAGEWGGRFVGLWPDESVRPSRGSSAETEKPDARGPGVDWIFSDDGQRGGVEKRVFEPGEAADRDEIGHPRNLGDPRTASEEVTVDQWTRLPGAELEALVQADADLFFLPLLLLLEHPSGEQWHFLFW